MWKKEAQQIELAMAVLKRDISQMIDRPVLDSHGTQLRALQINSASDIEFTRAGIVNPMGYYKRSDMERVAYSIENGQLIRTVWPVLDRTMNTPAQKTVLLNKIGSINVQFVNAAGQRINNWQNGNSGAAFPAAMIIRFGFGKLGSVERVITIAARGATNNAEN